MRNIKKIGIIIGVLFIGVLLGKTFFGSEKNAEIADHETESAVEHWTCSMHPQIDLPEFGACPICGMDLIPKTESEGSTLDPNQFKMTQNAIELANIQTTTIGVSKMINSLVLSGKIKENEKTNATQTAHFGGRVEKLYVNFTGEKVDKGQLLALIYSPELVTAQKELLEAVKVKKTQPSLYNAVYNKLKLWKLSEKQISDIEQTGQIKTNFPVYSDMSGIISKKMVDEGDHVKTGQTLYSISNLTTLWAIFDVYERDLKHIKIDQQIEVRPNAFPAKKIKAKISFINPVLNSKSRTVSIRAEISNTENLLKPGMLLTSNITIDGQKEEQSTLIVPKSAVLWTGKRSVVYVKTSPNETVFEMREVELGSEISNGYVIISGLEKGEEVVANGTFTIDAAAQLQGKKSMMNRNGGKVAAGHDHGGVEADSKKEDALMIDPSTIDIKFKKQLGIVVNNYIPLKDVLILDKTEDAQSHAVKVKKALSKTEMSLLKGDAHMEWMKSLKAITNSLQVIEKSKVLDEQRNAFGELSVSLLRVLKGFGVELPVEKTLYLEFCPMANNNEGGYWLSYDKEIRNPYFGDKMLKCGSVKEVIKE